MPTTNISALKQRGESDTKGERDVLSLLIMGQHDCCEIHPRLEESFFTTPEHQTIFLWAKQQKPPRNLRDLYRELIKNDRHSREYSLGIIATLENRFAETSGEPSLEIANKFAFDLAIMRQGNPLLKGALEEINLINPGHPEQIKDYVEKIHTRTGILQKLWDPPTKKIKTPLDGITCAKEQQRQFKTDSVKTPFPKLNSLLRGGLKRQELVIIGARPGIGKTTLAADLLLHFTLHELKEREEVIFWTIEENIGETTNRLLGRLLKDDPFEPKKPQSIDNMELAYKKIAELPYCAIEERMSTEEFIALVRGRNKIFRSRIIMIDYINRIQYDKNSKIKTEDIEKSLSALRDLANEIDCTIIVFAQINRGVTSRDSQFPKASDLKDSGALEECGKIIILLHREYPYLQDLHIPENDPKYRQHQEDLRREENKAYIKLAKNRFGLGGKFQTFFYGSYLGFSEKEIFFD